MHLEVDRGASPSSSKVQSGEGEITVFLSYARADDDIYGMVSLFKTTLSHFIYAKSGRKVKAFLDQESIGWGELWRDRLEAEILAASVFIPLLSAAYLDSQNCRMEFNRFQANASSLGVNELLLPVLLINAPAIFNENSTDDVVREASARQWEVIEEAVLSDPKSSAWKTTMARLADRFVQSYETAEAKLAELEHDGTGSDDIVDPTNEDEEDDDEDRPGLAEVTISLGIKMDELTADSKLMAPAIAALGDAATGSGGVGSKPSAHQVQTWSLRLANSFKEPSERISEIGERMFNTTKYIDLDMRRLRSIATELMSINPGLADGYNKALGQLTGLGAVGEQLNSLLDQMKPAETFSVPIRKALRPARRGLTRVTDSLRLMEAWEPIQM